MNKKSDRDGIYMSIQNLRSLEHRAKVILSFLEPNSQLEDWVEAKINQAAKDIGEVAEYFMFRDKKLHPDLKKYASIKMSRQDERYVESLLQGLLRRLGLHRDSSVYDSNHGFRATVPFDEDHGVTYRLDCDLRDASQDPKKDFVWTLIEEKHGSSRENLIKGQETLETILKALRDQLKIDKSNYEKMREMESLGVERTMKNRWEDSLFRG